MSALTGTNGAPSRNEPRTNSSISSFTRSNACGSNQIGFRDRDDPAGNCEQPANIEMLASLRLDGFVGRHHQQQQIDAAGAGEHVADEALVPRHIDEAETHAIDDSGRQIPDRS